MPQQILNTPRETTHQRIAAALEAIEQNMSDEHEAVNIDYDNTTSGLNANKVQSAIDELALAGFVTNTVNNLVNYYLKSETYNKAEVDSLINAVKNSRFEAVSTLPTTNIKTNVIYLVPKSPTQTNNAKDEYINLDGTSSGWEKIGDTEVDLSGYVTTTALDTALSNYTTTANLTNLLNNKVDKVNGKGLSTNDYTTAEKTKLAGISEGATQTIANPADTATETLSKLEVGGVVYDVPQGASGATELSELTDVNLTDVEDNDILQYDETANKWKNSNALQGAKTATGNPITVTDAAPVNAVNLSMDLEPIQDLHGYDHPWVGGAGKNKLPMTVDGIKSANTSGSWSGNSYTLDGITFTILTDSDNNVIGIRCNGQASGSIRFYIFRGSVTVSSGSKFNLNASKNTNNYDAHVATDSSDIAYIVGTSAQTAETTLSDTTFTQVFFYFNSNYNDDITIYPMIRLSTETDSTFAPYTNISPITGQTEVVIEDVGKNLFDASEIVEGTISTTNGDNSENSTAKRTNNYIKVTGGSNYVISGLNTTIRLHQYAHDKTYIGNALQNNGNFTVNNNCEYIRIAGNAGWESNILMIRLATETATTYEPYQGKTYTIQIGQTVYGCHHDVTRGKMVVTHGEVDLGTLNWRYVSGIFYANVEQGTSFMSNAICSAYENAGTGIEPTNGQFGYGGTYIQAGYRAIRINDTRYTDATTFKTAVTGQQLVYELATPFTINLAPQQIKLLENTNTISTDYEGDTITLEYQPNNAIGEAVRVVEESYDAELEYLKPTGSISSGDTKAVTGGVVYDYHNTTPLNPKANLYIEKSGNVINIEARDVDGSAFTSYPGAGGYTLPTGYRPKRMLIVCVYVYTTYDNKKHHGIIKIRDDGTMDGHFIDFSGNEHKIYDSSYSSEVSFNTSYIV